MSKNILLEKVKKTIECSKLLHPILNEHLWAEYEDMEICCWCGIVQRADKTNKECPGKIEIKIK